MTAPRRAPAGPDAPGAPGVARSPGARTRAVRAGVASDREHGAVIPPLHLSTTFTFEAPGRPRRYDYTRSGNPTRDVAADAVAALEGGAGAVLTASGMAAVTTVLHLLEPGDLLVAAHDAYGGTHRLVEALAARGAFRVRWADLTDPDARDEALALAPRMVWVETPSNPLLRITDIEAVVVGARTHGALVVVDNTFLSPANQRPLDLGADVVVHSTTKYLNGHSDVVGGAVVAADPDRHDRLAWWANCLGVTGSPFDAYLLTRGLRTLHARIALHETNAAAVVGVLRDSPAVSAVWWPGLPEHPGHGLAARQQTGFGGMMSFEVRGGPPAVAAFLDGLRHVSLAESLGGVESLVAHPATMTHASMTAEARRRAGIGDALLRLSVGIEDPADLVADVEAGLARAAAADAEATAGGLAGSTAGTAVAASLGVAAAAIAATAAGPGPGSGAPGSVAADAPGAHPGPACPDPTPTPRTP